MTPSSFSKKLDVYVRIIEEIKAGLNGEPFAWGSGEAGHYFSKLPQLGCTLVTKNWLKRNKYRLKRGVDPVGSVYFPAPISKHCDVYVLECQCVKFAP